VSRPTASAKQKLDDDDLVAFGLVAIRNGPDGVESVGQRAVDPQVVATSDHDAETVIESLHDSLCQTWDEEVADR